VKCAECGRECLLSWHVKTELWRMLPKSRWKDVLDIECFIAILSRRINRRLVIYPDDFSGIVIAAKRVRGYLNRVPSSPMFPRRKGVIGKGD
jgi:hypothetical protein